MAVYFAREADNGAGTEYIGKEFELRLSINASCVAQYTTNALKRLDKNMTTTTDTKRVSTTVCPNCKSTSCDRIPRPAIYKLLFPWVMAKHYLCLKCFKKFSKKV
jgi:hypothetical protein